MDALIQPHVLVLDPDPSSRVLLTAVLRRSGLRVTACNDEREAARHCLRRGRYALVILSSDMPAFASLLEELHAAAADERPKAIVATTSEVALPPLAADVVLLKPFHLNELYAAIAACCSTCGDERARTRTDTRSRQASAPATVEVQS